MKIFSLLRNETFFGTDLQINKQIYFERIVLLFRRFQR